MSFLYFIIVLADFVLLAGVFYLTSTLWKTRVPFVPTAKERIEKALELVSLTPDDVVVDLGSGDGRIVIAAACKGARAIGYEVNPLLVRYARFMIGRLGLSDRAHIIQQDFFNASLQHASVVTIYGIGSIMDRVEEKILREVKPNARVVSFVFPFPNSQISKQDNEIFVYRV